MSRVQIRLGRCAGLSAPLLFADNKKKFSHNMDCYMTGENPVS